MQLSAQCDLRIQFIIWLFWFTQLFFIFLQHSWEELRHCIVQNRGVHKEMQKNSIKINNFSDSNQFFKFLSNKHDVSLSHFLSVSMSLWVYVSLSLCLSVSLSLCLSVSLSLCLSVSLRLSVSLSLCLSVSLSLCLSVSAPPRLSVNLSSCLSVSFSLHSQFPSVCAASKPLTKMSLSCFMFLPFPVKKKRPSQNPSGCVARRRRRPYFAVATTGGDCYKSFYTCKCNFLPCSTGRRNCILYPCPAG